MNLPDTASHRLGRSDVLHLAARPQRLSVEHGSLWVTQDGEPEDMQIDAGASLEFDGHTALLVSTLGGPALLRVTPLAPSHAAHATHQARTAGAWHWLPRAAAALRGGAAA